VAMVRRGAAATAPDAGGMHIAPVLGPAADVQAAYRLQWREKIAGYLVDMAEPVLFLILAAIAAVMIRFDPTRRFYRWMAAYLVLLAAAWLNQPLYGLAHFETLQDVALWRLTLIEGLLLGTWIMAWQAELDANGSRWIPLACAVLVTIFMVARWLSTPLLFPHLPAPTVDAYFGLRKAARFGLLALLAIVVGLGFYRAQRVRRFLLLALLAGTVGLFGPEVSLLGIPGIWFPFGVGVSRTEYANGLFAVTLLIYLLCQRRKAALVVAPAVSSGRIEAGSGSW
jgi:hypothetical protein